MWNPTPKITCPTLLLDEYRVIRNISRMAAKVATGNKHFRPHFKTHQSIEVGRWFRDVGVRRIAVSSVQMAAYFAADGWEDILIAFPFNPLEWPAIRELSSRTRLGVTISNLEAAQWLHRYADVPVHVWIELEAGQQRTGFTRGQQERLPEACRLLLNQSACIPTGVMVHAGSTYQARGKEEVTLAAQAAMQSMRQVMHHIPEPFRQEVSFGDTPSASLVDEFPRITELRPGNFVFYDLMQWQIGSCTLDDIALAVACPVIDGHFLYGGAVHLSKDSISHRGRSMYGAIAQATDSGWQANMIDDMPFLTGLSQEHGWIDSRAPALPHGAVVPVMPVHSCLAVDSLPYYVTTSGRRIEKM